MGESFADQNYSLTLGPPTRSRNRKISDGAKCPEDPGNKSGLHNPGERLVGAPG